MTVSIVSQANTNASHSHRIATIPPEFQSEQSTLIHDTNRQYPLLHSVEPEIINYDADLDRYQFPASHLRLEGEDLIAGQRRFSFRSNSTGQRRLCQSVGIPTDYFPKLPSNLQAALVQFHLQKAYRSGCKKFDDDHSIIYSRNGEFVGIGRNDLLVLTASQVLAAVRQGVADDDASLQVADLSLDRESLTLNIVSPYRSGAIRAGDIMSAGLQVRHHLLGDAATTVMAYLIRRVCGNGMVHRECLGSRRTPRTRRLANARNDAGDLQFEQVRRLVASTWKTLDERLNVIRRLQEQRFSFDNLIQFLRRARLNSQQLADSLFQAWQQEGREETAFGLLNALTRLTTHSTEITERQRTILMRLAGVFAHREQHICPRCFSVLD